MQNIKIKSGQGDYCCEFQNSLEKLFLELKTISDAVLIVDKKVATIYASQISTLQDKIPTIAITASEEEKTLSGAVRVLEFIQKTNCKKSSIVIGIGGGIIQDLVAFATHVYYRGIRYYFVPTTLLSMSDSCIGAKSSINFNGYKNQLGSFHSPSKVLICAEFLNTLNADDIRSGYGEILKLSLIGSKDCYENITKTINNFGFSKSYLNEIICDSLIIKKKIIEEDEYELDQRRILNYGHTFGHSLEGLTNYEIPHGLAVAWGIDMVNWISVKNNYLLKNEFVEIHNFIKKYFYFDISKNISANDLIEWGKRDKKVSGNSINLALLLKIGRVQIFPIQFDDNLSAIITDYLDMWDTNNSK